jgi:hypothetical protein
MKNRSFDDGLTYFFSRRIHGRDSSNDMHELAKPESESEKTESVIEDILRWADDGGKMLDIDWQPNSQVQPGPSARTDKQFRNIS